MCDSPTSEQLDGFYSCSVKDKRVKVSLCVTNKQQSMKAYGGVDVYIHIFLTLAIVEGKWSASPPGKSCRYSLDRRLSGPQSRSWPRGEEKIIDPTGSRIPTPRSSSP
jgi:hypothetical protein